VPEGLGPPQNEISATVAINAILAHRDDLVVYVPSAAVHRHGIDFAIVVLTSPMGSPRSFPWTRGATGPRFTISCPDPRLAKAVVDRLTHRPHIIDTGNESWRFRHGLTRTTKKGGDPPADDRRAWPRRSASPSGLGSTTTPRAPLRQDQLSTTTDARWSHFKRPRWGHRECPHRPIPPAEFVNPGRLESSGLRSSAQCSTSRTPSSRARSPRKAMVNRPSHASYSSARGLCVSTGREGGSSTGVSTSNTPAWRG
jgi:hypothetical protein